MNDHQVRVRLGEFEFEANGDKQSVDARYERFMQAVVALKGLSIPMEERVRKELVEAGETPEAIRLTGSTGAMAKVDESMRCGGHVDLAGIMHLDGRTVVIDMIPSGRTFGDKQRDALHLAMYGYVALSGKAPTGHWLMRTLSKAGLGDVQRVDDYRDESATTTTGKYRGKEYWLNDEGKRQVEAMIGLMRGAESDGGV